MENNGKFWRNQIKVYHFNNLGEIQKELNKFYIDKFVIATQVFPLFKEGYNWVVIVYYKILKGA